MWKPNEVEKSKLISLYSECELTVDRLPHTEAFNQLYDQFGNESVSKNELFLALANMRKRKELPRKPR